MNNLIQARFANPENGWIEFDLKTPGREWLLVISYTPNDFLHELVSALLLAIQGVPGTAHASVEPGRVEFLFSPIPLTSLIVFEIREYLNWTSEQKHADAVVSLQGDISAIVIPFWRAVKALEGRLSPAAYQELMRLEFPSEKLLLLSQSLGKA